MGRGGDRMKWERTVDHTWVTQDTPDRQQIWTHTPLTSRQTNRQSCVEYRPEVSVGGNTPETRCPLPLAAGFQEVTMRMTSSWHVQTLLHLRFMKSWFFSEQTSSGIQFQMSKASLLSHKTIFTQISLASTWVNIDGVTETSGSTNSSFARTVF